MMYVDTTSYTQKRLFVRLLKGCIVSDDDVDHQDTNQTTVQLKEAYKKEKLTIIRRIQPWMVDPQMFKQTKQDDLARLIQTYRHKGLELEEEEKNLTAEAITETSREELIQDQIETEVEAYKCIIRTTLEKNKDHFGKDVFDNEFCLQRYKFWPSHAAQLPLLNLCAQMLLGTTLTAMENERFHSAASFIHSKLRSSLSVDSVERLTLCKMYLQAALKRLF